MNSLLTRSITTAARTSFRGPRGLSPRFASTHAGATVPQGSRGMLNLEPEVYPLLVIVFVACSGGTYMAFNKILHDQDLRLLPNQAVHEALDFDKPRFGVQAGGQTYKDPQGWTRIRVKEEGSKSA